VQIRILEETKIVESNGWVARIRPPTEKWNGRVILLLHGWTGDENIMWIFARKIPTSCWMIAPRGPLNSTEGGYAWAVPQNGERPEISQFTRHSKELIKRLAEWIPEFSSKSRLDIVGFSQGAAMTYSMCLETNPTKVAPLAGYLPPGFEDQLNDRDLTGLQMFIAHNTDDTVVSSEESQKAASYFSKHGATVHYCDSTGGHKISSSCFHGLDKFLEN
jgi:predicted esterase